MSPLVVDLGITDPVTVDTTIQNIITIIVRTIIARTITIIFVDFTGGVIGRIVIDRPFYDLKYDRTCATLLGDEHDLLGIARYRTAMGAEPVTEPTGPKSLYEQTTSRIDPVGMSCAGSPDPNPRHLTDNPHVADSVAMAWQHIDRSHLTAIGRKDLEVVRHRG